MSYFRKDVDRYKTRKLVEKIADISYTVVNTEADALLLENELIKKYQPRYNILLKDGKTYPYICVTKEEYPRVFSTRKVIKGAGIYFGPYAHQGAMYSVLKLINDLFRPRTCRTPLTKQSVDTGKHGVCLDYHIHRCGGPCVGKQRKEEYRENIRQAAEVLKGNTRLLMKLTYEEMQACAENLQFEKAEEMKQRYLLLESYCAKSEVVSHTIADLDVFSITRGEGESVAYVNYLHVVNGAVNQALTFEYKCDMEESEAELLASAIMDIRQRGESEAKEIVVPFDMEWPIEGVMFHVPQRGDRKKLLDLSLLNGRQYRLDKLKQAEKLNPEQRQTRLMKQLQQLLGLDKLPMHIECFDNSNISGTDAVAACVVYRNMRPSKKDYRHYIIRSSDTRDDYMQMQEVVRRRYQTMKEEGSALPDLIITDGGTGHMNAVREVVIDELQLPIPIAGLAKDGRHRTNQLLFGFPPQAVSVGAKDELFHILTRMQDEVHRFAITFHRNKRSKRALHSEINDIKGIGEKTSVQLIRHFKSVKRIRQADLSALEAVVGKRKAQLIHAYFQGQQ